MGYMYIPKPNNLLLCCVA